MTEKTNTEGIEFDGTDDYEQVPTRDFDIPNSITLDIPEYYLKDLIRERQEWEEWRRSHEYFCESDFEED